MDSQEAISLAESALVKLGTPSRLDCDQFFLDSRFNSIPWVPTFAWQVGRTVWAVEIYRGDREPTTTIQAMRDVVAVDQSIQPALFIPPGQPFDHLTNICGSNGIALIAQPADEYDVLLFQPGLSNSLAAVVLRIPNWIVTGLAALTNLSDDSRDDTKNCAKTG
jgi:hypothetical protein